MLLSIIIVSYNTKALTLQTLASVEASLQKAPKLKAETEIFVVDNDSTDGSKEALSKLKTHYQHFHFIESKQNVGFAGANNLAIEKAVGKYVLLLNSDTVVQDDALAKMVEAFEAHPLHEDTAVLERTAGRLDRLGVLSLALQNQDGTHQPQGGSFPTLLSLATHMLFLDDIPVIGKLLPSTQHTGRNVHQPQSALYQVDWLGGTAMMIRKEVFAEVGLLDNNIFMYGEDIEFCMRAKFHHWDVAILPTAHIVHIGSASSSSKNAIIGEIKGYVYIWAKHKPLWQKSLLKWILGTGILLRRVLFGTMIRDEHRATIYKEASQVLRSL